MTFLDWLLDWFPAWRRFRGGHWERWIVDLCGAQSDVWFHRDRCWRELAADPCLPIFGDRPTLQCRGTPRCEDYRGPKRSCVHEGAPTVTDAT